MSTNRILYPAFEKLVMTAEKAAAFIKSDMVLCTSGFGTGYPKAIPTALSQSKHAKNLTLINGAARGEMHIGAMARAGILGRVYGWQINEAMRDAINAGEFAFSDMHLGQLEDKLHKGYCGHIDTVIIECCKICEDGSIIPTLSAGIIETAAQMADFILLEINEYISVEIEGLHDFGAPYGAIPASPCHRMGTPSMKIDTSKVKGIVYTNYPDTDLSYPDATELYDKLAENVMAVLRKEIASGAIPENFTFQSGTGVVANLVLVGLISQGFENLKMYTEVMSDQAIFAIREGIISEATSTTLDITPIAYEDLFRNIDFFKEHIVLRPLHLTNGVPQIIAQDLVSINTAWEADIYGNINSSHAIGTQMINGLGGSNDFARSSKLSIFTTPSIAKGNTISRIVPMVPHVDSTEHDTDIIVTECGYADLRGLSPKERARVIIDNCAHPDYRPQLHKYFNDAVAMCGPCQTPHDFSQSLSWYDRFLATGTMLEE